MLFTDLVKRFPSLVHAKSRSAKHFRNNRNNSLPILLGLATGGEWGLSFCIGIRFLVQIAILQEENSFYGNSLFLYPSPSIKNKADFL
jgi:hypothetical protein